MDGWVIGIVEDTVDKVDRNDPLLSNALRTGKVIPNSIESMKSFDFSKNYSIGYLQATYYYRTYSFFQQNLPSNKQQQQQNLHSNPLKLAQSIDLKAIITENQSK